MGAMKLRAIALTLSLLFFLLLLLDIFLFYESRPRTHHHKFIVQSTAYTRLCITKNILTVNGQYPGPTLRARRGDTLIVTVLNHASDNITIHWHGVRQPRDPWNDGASYVTQCPIRPGQNYIYRVQLTKEEGTLWWHAHTGVSRATVHGAIVIQPKLGTSYPFPKPHGEMPIVLGEWWNKDVMQIYRETVARGGDPMHSDAYTINGHPGHLYPCSNSDLFTMMVEHGKTYLLRVINAALEEQLFFAIAQHRMTLVGVDGSYTKPFATDYILISPGQSMNLLVEANQHPADYYMAASAYDNGMGSMGSMGGMGGMSGMDQPMMANQTTTTAILRYTVTDKETRLSPTMPTLPSYQDSNSANNYTSHIRSLAVKKHPVDVPQHVDEHLFFTLSMNLEDCKGNMTCDGPMGMRNSASINNITFVYPSVDILSAYYYGIHGISEEDFPSKPIKAFNYTSGGPMNDQAASKMGTKVKVLEYGASVELVLQGTSMVLGESHPMHLHGHSFYVIGWGYGNYDPVHDPPNYNLVDPPKVSTFVVPVNGWIAIRFKADNPGVWLLHCHFAHHQSYGMSTVFIVKNGASKQAHVLDPPKDLPTC